MTVLREIVARLGFEVDKTGFQAAERGIAQVQTQLAATSKKLGVVGVAATAAGGRVASAGSRFAATGKAAASTRAGMAVGATGASAFGGALGKLVAAVGIAQTLRSIVQLASDANETGSVLDRVFGAEGAAQVKSWSQTASSTLGRSRYQLQEYAAGLGGMIEPMVQNKAKAQAMSTTFATLAVDLSSAFSGTTEEEALTALKGGLTGADMALKRFGITMDDATLQQYANEKGIHKKLAAMSNAEKTELRYQYILANTKSAQGDAARSSGTFGNASKALGGALKDLGTELGQRALPVLERMVVGASKALATFKNLAAGTHVLEAALAVLGAAAVVTGAKMLAPFIVPAAAAAALILIIDELWNMFGGGESVIGDFIEEAGGLGTVDELVRNLSAGIDILAESWRNLWTDTDNGSDSIIEFVGWIELVQTAGVNAADALMRLGNKISDLVRSVPGLGYLVGLGDLPARELNASDRAAGRGVDAPLMTAQESARQNLRDRNAAGRNRRAATKSGRALARGYDAAVEEIKYARASSSAVGAAPTATAPAAPAATQPVIVQSGNTTVTVNVNGGNLAEVRRVVLDALAAERRKNNAALARPGSG